MFKADTMIDELSWHCLIKAYYDVKLTYQAKMMSVAYMKITQ